VFRESWWVALAALGTAGGIGLLVLAVDDKDSGGTVTVVLAVAVAWSFIASGLIAWIRGPSVRLARLMVAIGFMLLVGPLLQFTSSSLLFVLGVWIANAWVLLFAYFLVTFPHAWSSRDRWILAPLVVALVPLELVWLFFWDPGAPGNALLVWRNEGVANGIDWAQRAIIAAGVLLVSGVLIWRWHVASKPLRRSLTPILAGGVAAELASIIVILEGVGVEWEFVTWILEALLIAVALAVLADMLRARLARSAVGELVVELSADETPTDLRASLARALHDQSLRVVYWLPEFEAYADASGRRVEIAAEPRRTATVVRRGGTPVAALLHDASLRMEPELLDGVVAAAGIALENARLESELRARVEELSRSRARIVEVAQAERRRLERDLHDGAQQRLVALTLQLAGLERHLAGNADGLDVLGDAKHELEESLRELRELARGIHPAVITERGLAAALEGVVSRASLPVELTVDVDERLPEAVELAGYYLVSEALTNVAKHAHASSARVEVVVAQGRLVVEVDDDGVGGADRSAGTGLSGLEDRLEALGGLLRVSSELGVGTSVRAEIPYAEAAIDADAVTLQSP
jgi:signal transduction histidine kinase